MHICRYTYIRISKQVNIYIYRERERERQRQRDRPKTSPVLRTTIPPDIISCPKLLIKLTSTILQILYETWTKLLRRGLYREYVGSRLYVRSFCRFLLRSFDNGPNAQHSFCQPYAPQANIEADKEPFNEDSSLYMTPVEPLKRRVVHKGPFEKFNVSLGECRQF